MKITSEHFGLKLRKKHWLNNNYFIPLGFSQNNKYVIGENTNGDGDEWASNIDEWEFYEEPKKKVIKRLAPAVIDNDGRGDFSITHVLYESEECARQSYGKFFVKWPASESMFIDVEVEE